jgi:hypothetical protein
MRIRGTKTISGEEKTTGEKLMGKTGGRLRTS